MKAIQILTMSLSLFTALASGAARAEGVPKVTIGAGAQTVAGSGMRGIIKVSLSGVKAERGQNSCNANVCDDVYYFEVSASAARAGAGRIAAFDVTLNPISLHETIDAREASSYPGQIGEISHVALLPIQASREVALGKDVKARVDLISISYTMQEREAIDDTEYFLTFSTSLIGFQYLRAMSDQKGLESFYGFDLGDAGLELGTNHYWSQGFRTRVSVGAKAGLAVGGADGRGLTASFESKEFARISAVLDGKLGQLEAYLEGSASQLALGTDGESALQLEFGALARF